MKTSSAKAKGRRLQNWTRDYILKISEGLLTDEDVRAAIMGEAGEDIKLSGKARQLFPVTIEVKNKERLNMWDAYRQSEYHAADLGYEPVVIAARNRQKPLAIVDAEFFLKLVRGYYG